MESHKTLFPPYPEIDQAAYDDIADAVIAAQPAPEDTLHYPELLDVGNGVLYCNPDSGLAPVKLLLPCSQFSASFALAWKHRIELWEIIYHSLVSQVDKRLCSPSGSVVGCLS